MSTGDIVENKKYKNITEIWLNDHIKWRVMRVNKKYITDNINDYENF
ncbi:glucuronate isomerase [Fusobacterium sp. FSA-380-WT-3A]|nr:glucuronate isomerase [Fusobacterium sp. FSA-380-WT-3A]